MIGYYIHHHGRGHLSRALAIAAALDVPVTALSTLPRSSGWDGPWVELAADTDDSAPEQRDPQAGGRLHWAPLASPGLRGRMAAIAGWIDREAPSALVVDVSVEVALLGRLLGIPVITMAMPGERQDAAHDLGFAVSAAVIAAWPQSAHSLAAGLPDHARSRVRPVGAISRFAPVAAAAGVDAPRRVLVFSGGGGDDFAPDLVDAARRATPDWSWSHIGGQSGRWVDDPWSRIREADVVITHAGENAIAEVSAARTPAVVIPQRRPHGEQAATARALRDGAYPVTVLPGFAREDWADLLARTARLQPCAWSRWNDGSGALRAAAIIQDVARGSAQR